LLIEADGVFGAPFFFMERLPGKSLLEVLERQPWRVWDLPARMAELHARLHHLSPDGFPGSHEDLHTRSLNEIAARIEAYRLEGLRAGLDWLHANRPEGMPSARMLHLDWHPLNLIRDDSGLAVIDWSDADIGDPHMDVATTLLALRCLPPPDVPAWERPFVPWYREMVARRYLRAYQRSAPLDVARLCYFSAWAALRRLARYGRSFCLGARSGWKRSALRQLDGKHCATLCSYFARYSGVRVTLDNANEDDA
jgi:aminoglycoside phosphotransferase (APT) family kinase protein